MRLTKFNYDVAFSFTQQDEGLAFTFYKLLKDRLRCFIYSEEQKKLAGGDGETLFNSVYSKETRIVVILFRNLYGKTKWTRIEETAIRNRGYEDGYDFVLLIPTETPVSPPDWLPKNRLWIGLEQWGIESAASVIEAKVQEYGGVVKIESISDLVARTENKLKEKQERERILKSDRAIILASEELNSLKEIIKRHEKEIKDKNH